MTEAVSDSQRPDTFQTVESAPAVDRPIATLAYRVVAIVFFGWLFYYFLTGAGGPTRLAVTMVPVTFLIYTLDQYRKGTLYQGLGTPIATVIAVVYSLLSIAIAVYMNIEFDMIGTVRAGFWNTRDIVVGGAMVLLVMEFARRQYFVLFVLNIIVTIYAVYGSYVPGMFNHYGIDWERVVTSMSVEMSTGVFSRLPQLALTLIGSFLLVLSVLRAFGCIDSILKGASRIATKSPHALPQAAVIGSLGVAAVSGSGAANAVTTGSATIPAMIQAGIPREKAAAIEASASLGGQLMPPIMGISAFLMAEFLGRSYFDVVARGYAPALIFFAGVIVSVYLLSIRHPVRTGGLKVEAVDWSDRINILAFALVVLGLIVMMAVMHLAPMFAAIDTFAIVGSLLLAKFVVENLVRRGEPLHRAIIRPVKNFLETFTSMTAELTLLLATLAILTGTFTVTGVPTKVGFLLLDAAGVNVAVMALAAFGFGALLGMGLPPAPTYILVALVIAPPMIKAGIDPWAVHFFAFFLAVWGELTPPTSVVAAVTARIAEASFLRTLFDGIKLCVSLFILMAAMFTHPELVLEPGIAQLGAIGLVLASTIGLIFALQAHFLESRGADRVVRVVLAGIALLAIHPASEIAIPAAGVVVLFVAWWVLVARVRDDAVRAASA